MNQKEVNELRRRFRPEKNAISRIYGCYVNGNREIVSYLDTSLGLMPEEEVELYLARLKKTLTGSLGKNLIDIVFSTQQVMDSDEHKLLSDLRNSQLQNADAREAFYRTVIDQLDLGENGYLILLASDVYDVPRRGRDGRDRADESENMFSYIICALCPVKDAGYALRYFHDANEFHGSAIGQMVDNTYLGFLFPAFDDRAANIYNALYYARKPGDLHQEFIDAVFRTGPVMSADEQREAFHDVLSESLEDECGYDLLQTVHEQLLERMEEHREEQNPEPLSLTPRELCDILGNGGASPERLEAFERSCGERFGENAALTPENLIDSKRFEIITPEARVTVNPSCSYVVEYRVIDGRKYLLIPADHDVTVNGMPVRVVQSSGDAESE
ncbi:MAG: DUF4317 domain-containing protein [Oscillibacter sp.]|nr:DUF4317 domain-containing protein [Oscillibacter sp.]